MEHIRSPVTEQLICGTPKQRIQEGCSLNVAYAAVMGVTKAEICPACLKRLSEVFAGAGG